ncbi:MAG: helix-turn-helix domain-containing protein, partial [Pseudomonadales bacterium]|nr:helix-turn-helix domain-containing protein [Pseudomonadales bacterium]
ELVAKGEFRKDLFYRVSGLNIEIPPLKDRQDKGALFANIIKAKSENERQLEIDPQIMALFLAHPWPGNIRQFISVLEIALAMADGDPINNWHLPDDFYDDLENSSTDYTYTAASALTEQGGSSLTADSKVFAEIVLAEQPSAPVSDAGSVMAISRQQPQIQYKSMEIAADSDTSECYQRCNGNLSKTAKALGISRNTLYKRLRLLGLK